MGVVLGGFIGYAYGILLIFRFKEHTTPVTAYVRYRFCAGNVIEAHEHAGDFKKP
jgi:hypothetical protein